MRVTLALLSFLVSLSFVCAANISEITPFQTVKATAVADTIYRFAVPATINAPVSINVVVASDITLKVGVAPTQDPADFRTKKYLSSAGYYEVLSTDQHVDIIVEASASATAVDFEFFVWSAKLLPGGGVDIPVKDQVPFPATFTACGNEKSVINAFGFDADVNFCVIGGECTTHHLSPAARLELPTATAGLYSLDFTTVSAHDTNAHFTLDTFAIHDVEVDHAYFFEVPDLVGCHIHWRVNHIDTDIMAYPELVASATDALFDASTPASLSVGFAPRPLDMSTQSEGFGPVEEATDVLVCHPSGLDNLHFGARPFGYSTRFFPNAANEFPMLSATVFVGFDHKLLRQNATPTPSVYHWIPTRGEPLHLAAPMMDRPLATMADSTRTDVDHFFMAHHADDSNGAGLPLRIVTMPSKVGQGPDLVPLNFDEAKGNMNIVHNTSATVVVNGNSVANVAVARHQADSRSPEDMYWMTIDPEGDESVAPAAINVLAGASINMTPTNHALEGVSSVILRNARRNSVHWFSFMVNSQDVSAYHVSVRGVDTDTKVHCSIHASQGVPLPIPEYAQWSASTTAPDDGLDLPITYGFRDGAVFVGVVFHADVPTRPIRVSFSAEGGDDHNLKDSVPTAAHLSAEDSALAFQLIDASANEMLGFDFMGALVEVGDDWAQRSVNCGRQGSAAIVGEFFMGDGKQTFRIESDATNGSAEARKVVGTTTAATSEVGVLPQVKGRLAVYLDNWDTIKCPTVADGVDLSVTMFSSYVIAPQEGAHHIPLPEDGWRFIHMQPAVAQARFLDFTAKRGVFEEHAKLDIDLISRNEDRPLCDIDFGDFTDSSPREFTCSAHQSYTDTDFQPETVIRIHTQSGAEGAMLNAAIDVKFRLENEIFAGDSITATFPANDNSVRSQVLAVPSVESLVDIFYVGRSRMRFGQPEATTKFHMCIASAPVSVASAEELSVSQNCDILRKSQTLATHVPMDVARSEMMLDPNNNRITNFVWVYTAITGAHADTVAVDFDVVPVFPLNGGAAAPFSEVNFHLPRMRLMPEAFMAFEIKVAPNAANSAAADAADPQPLPWGALKAQPEPTNGLAVSLKPVEYTTAFTADDLMHTQFNSYYTVDFLHFFDIIDDEGRTAASSGFHTLTMNAKDVAELSTATEERSLVVLFKVRKMFGYGQDMIDFAMETVHTPVMVSLDEDAELLERGAAGPFLHKAGTPNPLFQKYGSIVDTYSTDDVMVELCKGSAKVIYDYQPTMPEQANRLEDFTAVHPWPTFQPASEGAIAIDLGRELEMLVHNDVLTNPSNAMGNVPFYINVDANNADQDLVYEFVDVFHHASRPINGPYVGELVTVTSLRDRSVVLSVPVASIVEGHRASDVMYGIYVNDLADGHVLTTPCGAMMGDLLTSFVAENDGIRTVDGYNRVEIHVPASAAKKYLHGTVILSVVVQYRLSSGARMSGVYPSFAFDSKVLGFGMPMGGVIAIAVILSIIFLAGLVFGGYFLHRWIIKTAPRPKGYQVIDSSLGDEEVAFDDVMGAPAGDQH